MKTVLFAIAMKELGAKQAEVFEQKTLNALRTGGREFADATSVHCDYKEGLLKMCQQYRPDCLIVNEALKGTGNIFDIIKDIKSEFSDMQITVLFKEHRTVGDVVLANLTAAGIYNWVIAPWTAEAIANTFIAPKKMKDVEMYIPKIVEGANGLAFETKVVEKVEDKLEDLPDVFTSSTNNANKIRGVDDVSDGSGENKNTPYKRVVTGGYGFGRAFKPILSEAKIEETEENEFKPIAETVTVESNNDEEDDDLFVLPGEESEDDEEEARRRADIERLNALRALQEKERERERKEAQQNETAQKEDEYALPVYDSVDSSPEEDVVDATKARRMSLLDAIAEHKRLVAQQEAAKVAESKQTEEPEPEVETVETTPSVEANTKTVEEVKPVETAKPEEDIKPVKPAIDVVTSTVKSEKKTAQKNETEKPTLTLNDMHFKCKYDKVLFVRALPISSVVPAHLCKLMNAKFVDFNKASNNDGYFELLRTTIKEAAMPEGNKVVGDVVAGNGIEKLIEKFDHVVAILPEDAYAIETFVERYKGLFNAAIVDKCTTSSLTRKQLLKMVPNVQYIDTVKVDNCNREVVQSAINHELLMDNPEFAEGMRFFLRDIGE